MAIKKIISYFPKTISKLKKGLDLSNTYKIKGGYKGIYHYHIRKSGGTSVNYSFLSLSKLKAQTAYKKLIETPDHILINNDKLFLGWNRLLISIGKYYNAFSHNPVYKIRIPEDIYTFTILRDPVERFISYYYMVKTYCQRRIDHPSRKHFDDKMVTNLPKFMKFVPQKYLYGQLYIFSRTLKADEAAKSIKSKCKRILFTDELEKGYRLLSEDLGIKLPYLHVRKTKQKEVVNKRDLYLLKKVLKPELDFYNLVRNNRY